MAYEDVSNALMREQARRKALHQKLMQKNQYNPNQMVSGRVVPYSPIQGLSQIAEALINKNAYEKSSAKEKELAEQMGDERKDAVQRVTDQYFGRDEVFDAADMTTPERESALEADPKRAYMMASGDPYTEGMASALNPSSRGDYFTTIPLRNGKLAAFNSRANTFTYAGTDTPVPPEELIGAKYDPITKANQSAAGNAGANLGDMGVMPTDTGYSSTGVSKGTVEADVKSTKDTTSMMNPDSPEYKKERDLHNEDLNKYTTLTNTKTDVIDKIDNILSPDRKEGFEWNFGGYNAMIGQYAPNEDAAFVKGELDSLKDAMKAAGKQLATSDGTSVGQITEREWPILERQIDTLSPRLSEPDAREKLLTIRNKLMTMITTGQSVYADRWEGSPFMKDISVSKGGGDRPTDIPEDVWNELTPEQRELWKK